MGTLALITATWTALTSYAVNDLIINNGSVWQVIIAGTSSLDELDESDLGVAGAAHGSMALVVIGLLVSVPIVVFGSSVVLKLVERFPIIIQAGAAVLAFTAAKMIVGEPLLDPVFDAPSLVWLQWLTYGVAIVGVLALGAWSSRRSALPGESSAA